MKICERCGLVKRELINFDERELCKKCVEELKELKVKK